MTLCLWRGLTIKNFGTLFYKLVFLWIEPTQQIPNIGSNVAELDFSKSSF